MVLGTYRNGNYCVQIQKDGTKIRISKDDEFIPAFPESIDLKITNQCDIGCEFCHEGSNRAGLHGDLSAEFLDTLHPYTELAIGGGNPLSHPGLDGFLWKLKQKKIVANITVHQKHFLENLERLKIYVEDELIHGIGVSVTEPTEELIEKIKEVPNTIVHVIAGVISEQAMQKLANHDLKLLILGYKVFRRGETNLNVNTYHKLNEFKENLPQYFDKFRIISFDNLALKQLHVQSLVTKEQWDTCFMGDDGQFTMFIDLVSKTYALNSTVHYDNRKKIKNNIIEMFNDIRK